MAGRSAWDLPAPEQFVPYETVRQFAEGLTGKGEGTPPLHFTQTLQVDGSTTLNDLLAQSLTVNGPSALNGTLGVLGATSLAGTLGVAGLATLAGGLVVNGATQLNGTLGVTGAASLAGLTATSLTVNGNSQLNGTLGVTGATSLAGLTASGAAALNGGLTTTTLHATGATDLDTTLNVDGAATLQSTLHVVGAATFDAGITAASLTIDTLTVNTTLTSNGATNLGNADGDIETSIGVWTHRNAANTLTQFKADAGNNRVIVGSGTAMGSDTTPALHVVGRLYVAPESANDHAIQVRRSSAASNGWWIGLTTDPNGDLIFKDDGDLEIVRIGDTASSYQLKVTGKAHITGVTDFDSTVNVAGNLNATGAALNVTNDLLWASDGGGDIGASGANRPDQLYVKSAITCGGGASFGSGIVITGGVSVTTGGVSILAGGLAVTGNLGLFGTAAIAQQTVTGSRGGNAALADLLTKLANYGLIVDSTT